MNTLHRLRWKCNFGAVDKGSVSACVHFERTGASVCLFCRQCVPSVRRFGAGWALAVVGAFSYPVIKVLWNRQGNQSWLHRAAWVRWHHCSCCISIQNDRGASTRHGEWGSSVWLRTFLIFFPNDWAMAEIYSSTSHLYIQWMCLCAFAHAMPPPSKTVSLFLPNAYSWPSQKRIHRIPLPVGLSLSLSYPKSGVYYEAP